MAEEIGVGYVRLIPSMRGFGKETTKQLKKGLVGPARDAGKDAGDAAGDEIAKGVTAKAPKAAKPAGKKIAKGIKEGLKPGLDKVGAQLGDALVTPASGVGEETGKKIGDGIGEGIGDGLGDTKVDTRPLRSQLKDMADEVNDDLRKKGLEFEVDPARLAAIAKKVKATIEAAHPELSIGARTADVVAQVREQVQRDIEGVGREAGEEFNAGFEASTSDGGAGDGVREDLNRGMDDEGGRSGRSWLAGLAGSLGDGGGASRIEGAVTGMFAISAKSAATAFSAQFVGSVVAGLASGAAKLAHGLGAMVALLPAAAAAGVTAMVALKLAFVGVGDALTSAVTGDAKEFDEAIEGLAPSARGFAREVRGMREQIKGLQQSVQQSFFEKFSGDTKKLGGTYLPMVRSALSGVAASFGKAVHQSAGFLNMPETSGKLAMALGHVRGAVGNVAGALPSLVRAFVPLITVGSTFLPRLTAGFKRGAEALARMSEAGEKSGGIAKFIQGGIDKLRSLWDTAKQVGRIISNVVSVFGEFRGVGGIFDALGIKTGGLLDSFELMTAKAKAFFQSAAGGKAITEIFGIIQSLLSATMGTLARLVTIVGRVFAPILPQLADFAEAVANLQLALADALEPALQAVADALGVVLPVATDVMNVMAGNKTVMAALAGVLIGLYAAWKAVSVITQVAKMNLSGTKLAAGGATAGITALSMALIQMDAEEHQKQLDNLAEGFLAMDGAVNTTTKGMVYISQLAGQLDEVMGVLIDQNPRLAQTYIDNGAALGMTTEQQARYQAQLDQATAATENAIDATTRYKDQLRAMSDPVFAAADAQRRLAEAQAHVTELEDSGTATAAELQAAHEGVTQAAFDNQGAMLTLGAAMDSGKTSLNGVLGAAKNLVKQGAISRADYNATAFTATASMGRARTAVESVPPTHATTLTVNDYASAAVVGVRNMLAQLHDRHVTVTVGMAVGAGVGAVLAKFGAADGGIVPRYMASGGIGGPKGTDTVPTWLTPGEMVLNRSQQARLWAIADGAGMTGGNRRVVGGDDGSISKLERMVRAVALDVAAVTAGGAAPAPSRMVVDVTGGPPEMVTLFKKMIRTEGQGDPVRYLTP